MRSNRPFFYGALTVAAIVTLHIVWLDRQLGGPRATQFFSDLVAVPITCALAAACLSVARRHEGRGRRGWLLLAGAGLSWGAGETVWSYYELSLHREVPFPSFADIGFLGMIPLAAAAMLSFPTVPRRLASQARVILDGLIIAGSALFMSWATVLGPTFRQGSGDLIEQVIGLAYPIGDVVIIMIVLLVATRTPGGARAPVALIGAGLTFLALADSGFIYLTQNNAYATGNLVDAGWTAGFSFLALGALRARTEPPPPAVGDMAPTRANALVPYAAFLVATIVAGGVQVLEGRLGPFLFWNALFLVGCLLLRQLLMTMENLSLTRNLEVKVAERTAELADAMRDLEQANRLQDAFIASISHELRTPVTTMVGASATLLRPELAPTGPALELTEALRRSADRMNRLVEDLLMASGLSRDVACARIPFDVAPLLRSCASRVGPGGREVVTEGLDSATAIGDPEKLPLVVDHLLDNADKFSPPGASIRMRIERHDADVVISVSDEGPGIPPPLRERVFDRFYQVDGSSTRAHGGAGLGLFLARSLTEGMGGHLRVADTPGGGATLVISLSAVDPAPPEFDLRRRTDNEPSPSVTLNGGAPGS